MSLVLCSVTSWYGLVIRSWSSFKLLKDLNRTKDEDLREILQFWTCFALLQIFDFYFEIFVSWIPLYSLAKFVLLWYIITPSTHGASVIFQNFIEPKFQEKIAFLEKLFVVNFLSNLVHLDWIWEQVTLQLLSDAGTIDLSTQNRTGAANSTGLSLTEMEVLREKIERMLILVEKKIEERRSNPPMLAAATTTVTSTTRMTTVTVDLTADEDDDGFEALNPRDRKFRTPSPQQPQQRRQQGTTPVLTPQQSLKSSSARKTDSSSKSDQSPTIRPSYYPTRGIAATTSPVTRKEEPREVIEEEEDAQAALLDEMEQDEDYPSAAKPSSFFSSFYPATTPVQANAPGAIPGGNSSTKRRSAISAIRRFSGSVIAPLSSAAAAATPQQHQSTLEQGRTAQQGMNNELYDSLLSTSPLPAHQETSYEENENSGGTASRMFSWMSPRWPFAWSTDQSSPGAIVARKPSAGDDDDEEYRPSEDDFDVNEESGLNERPRNNANSGSLRSRRSSSLSSNQENNTGPVTRSRARQAPSQATHVQLGDPKPARKGKKKNF